MAPQAEPQTPPARRIAQIYTPQTPRHGPMDDLPVPKRLFADAQPPQQHLLTPQKTPKRRLMNAPKTTPRGSGRQAPRFSSSVRKLDEGVYLSSRHPHEPRPHLPGEGMMYVFRGKKVWRPFAQPERPLAPVRLFGDVEPSADSEAETDIE